ncbi:MAG: glycosyltransferase family 61 protein [Betaproteobacteria bacterium]
MIRDVDPETWARNPFVIAAPAAHSTLSAGAWHRALKIPVTPDAAACLARHQFFAAAKYAAAFESPELAAALQAAGREPLVDGVFFTGIANHWHFVVDGLGCLRDVADSGRRTLCVDAGYSDAQVDFVQRFAVAAGMERLRGVQRGSEACVGFRNGLFPTRRPFSERVHWVRSVLGVGKTAGGRGRLFVLRNGAATRRLLNQEAVAAMLASRFGFETVDPAAMTLDEQVRAFRDAEAIVGPHGAGLTNMIFAARPAVLVEFFHSEQQIFYHSLCYALGARHYAMKGAPAAAATDPSRIDNADFTIDEGGLAAALARVLPG